MPKTVTVTLGEQQHTIEQLRRRESSGWRKGLQGPIDELVGPIVTILEAPEVDLRDAAGLRAIGKAIVPLLTDSVDRCAEALVAYAPNLRDAVDQAYDEEIIAAFAEVLRLAFPFGALRTLFRPTTGPATPPTSPN
jgi:hypothetical protein